MQKNIQEIGQREIAVVVQFIRREEGNCRFVGCGVNSDGRPGLVWSGLGPGWHFLVTKGGAITDKI
jgi:hypothetical protein